MSVLRHSLDVYGIPYPAVDYYCTCNFCRAVWPGQIAYKLDMVAEMLGIQFQHHDAGADATACAMVSLECCKRAGTDDLAVLAKQHMISRGRLYPGGYEPCSGRRLFRGSAHRHREVSEPLPTGDENDGPLVTITGTLKSMTRYEAAKLVVDHGWRFKDTLTRSTSFLVVGEQDYQHFKSGTKSMKLLHAEDLLRSGHPIEIITEDDLLRMLGD